MSGRYVRSESSLTPCAVPQQERMAVVSCIHFMIQPLRHLNPFGRVEEKCNTPHPHPPLPSPTEEASHARYTTVLYVRRYQFQGAITVVCQDGPYSFRSRQALPAPEAPGAHTRRSTKPRFSHFARQLKSSPRRISVVF